MAELHLKRFDLPESLLPGRFASAPAPAVPTAPHPARISLVHDAAGFAQLEEQWRRLDNKAAPARHVFQCFDWLKSWSDIYGSATGRNPLCVALGHRGADLVFAWPLMRVRSGAITLLRWMSEPFGQYGDVLAAPGEDVAFWMDQSLQRIAALPGIDGVRLRHVRADGQAAPFLGQRFRDAKSAERAPWLDLGAFAGVAAYEARYSAAQRKRRKKIRTGLEQSLGPVTFVLMRGGLAGDAAIAQAIAEKSQWIEARGRQNRVLGCPAVAGFLQHLSRAHERGGEPGVELVVSQLSAGGRPVSWEIGLRAGGVHYAFITSHVNALTDYSPARLHMDLSQRQALNDGMTAFDLMLPHDSYKDSWSSASVAAKDYFLPLTLAGRIYGALYLERLRPALRRAYYRMPPAVLRLLKPVVGH